MSSLKSAVASVLRLVAVGLLLLGVVFFVLAYVAGRQGEEEFWQWFIGGAGLLSGLVLLIFSSPLAHLLTRNYE